MARTVFYRAHVCTFTLIRGYDDCIYYMHAIIRDWLVHPGRREPSTVDESGINRTTFCSGPRVLDLGKFDAW